MSVFLHYHQYWFWLWPILFVTQLIRAIHLYPSRKENPVQYRIAVVLSIFSLIVLSFAPIAAIASVSGVTLW